MNHFSYFFYYSISSLTGSYMKRKNTQAAEPFPKPWTVTEINTYLSTVLVGQRTVHCIGFVTWLFTWEKKKVKSYKNIHTILDLDKLSVKQPSPILIWTFLKHIHYKGSHKYSAQPCSLLFIYLSIHLISETFSNSFKKYSPEMKII